MSRASQTRRERIKKIKMHLARIQDQAFDLDNDDKAPILDDTIQAWRTLKDLMGEK